MRICRLRHQGHDHWARLVDDTSACLYDAAPYLGGTETARTVWLEDATLLPAVAPTKILCVGRNYREHAKELGHEVPPEPLLFFKPPSALLAHGAPIELPPASERVEHEGELAIVIGARLRDATPAQALAAIFGAACANDVTARDLQRKDGQWTRAKGFDTFCPIGPWLETEPGDLQALALTVRVGSELRQDGRTADMIWSVAELLAYASSVMTLEPGDVMLTGTPAGVGPLRPGDVVEVAISGLGSLRNPVALRAPRP